MRILIDKKNYIEINKENDEVSLTIKISKDETTSMLITAQLNKAQVDKLISALVSTKRDS